MASASLMHEAGHAKLVLWDNPEGWGREGGEMGFQDGGMYTCPRLICVDMWKGPPQCCEVIVLQLN